MAFVATVSEQSTQQRIAKVLVDGSSPPVVLSDWDDDWSTSVVWLEDGDLLVSSNRGTKFFRLPTNGGAAKPPMAIDTGSMSGIRASRARAPGDRGVFFAMESWGSRGYQLDQWLLDPKTGKARRLLEDAGNATYVPTGHIVFSRGAVLMAAPFDLQKLAVTGEVTALPGSVRTVNSWTHGDFSLSNDGTLVFAPGGRLGTDRTLVTIDRIGTRDQVRGRRTLLRDRAESLSGRPQRGGGDLQRQGHLRDMGCGGRPPRPQAGARAAQCRLRRPRVGAGRAAVACISGLARDKDDGIYLQRADGTGSPQAILKEESPEVGVWPTSFAPDGSGIIVTKVVGGKIDMLFVSISASGSASTPRVLRATPSNESRGAVFSGRAAGGFQLRRIRQGRSLRRRLRRRRRARPGNDGIERRRCGCRRGRTTANACSITTSRTR